MATRKGNTEDNLPEKSGAPESGVNNSQLTSLQEYAMRVTTAQIAGSMTQEDRTDLPASFRSTAASAHKLSRRMPGIALLEYVPMYGVSKSAESALCRATMNTMNQVRSKISGNRPYEAPDLQIYTAAVVDLRVFYNKICRLYTLLNTFNGINNYYPRTVIEALGFDYDDLSANLSVIRAWLLAHSAALNYFPISKASTAFIDHLTWSTNIYTDGDPLTSQMYMLEQVGFWSYEKVDTVKGLTMRFLPDKAKWSDFEKLWHDMVTALQTSSDVAIIAADIRRAFEESALLQSMDYPSEGATISIIKDTEILKSIMNAQIYPITRASIGTNFRIADAGNNILKCEPFIDYTFPGVDDAGTPYTSFGTGRQHFNSLELAPEPAEVHKYTRFMASGHTDTAHTTGTKLRYVFDSVGTELIVGCKYIVDVVGADPISMINGYSDGTGNYEPGEVLRTGTFSVGSGIVLHSNRTNMLGGTDPCSMTMTRLVQLHELYVAMSCFDWHPPLDIYVESCQNETDAGGVPTVHACVGTVEDIQCYVPINSDQVYNIQEANVLAALDL